MDQLLANSFGQSSQPPPVFPSSSFAQARDQEPGALQQGPVLLTNDQPYQHVLHQQRYPQQQYMMQPNDGMRHTVDDFGDDDGDSDDDGQQEAPRATRRKATERPEGSDQKRQAFSKRKRGIVLKAYQLYKLTDAKVFVFLVNDKGSSWMYATPGFGASLHPTQLRRLRELSGFGNPPKRPTEIMAHPRLDETDHQVDDRHLYVGSAEPLNLKCEVEVPDEPTIDPTVLAARAAAARDRDAQRNMLRRTASAHHSTPGTTSTNSHPGGGPSKSTGIQPSTVHTSVSGGGLVNSLPNAGMIHSLPSASMLTPMTSSGMLNCVSSGGMFAPIPGSSLLNAMAGSGMYSALPGGAMITHTPGSNENMYNHIPGGGVLTPIMMTADGGYSEAMMQPPGPVMTQMVNLSQMTSSTGLVEVQTHSMPIHTHKEQQQTTTTNNTNHSTVTLSSALTGQILSDGQGNMYRIVQESLDPSPPNAPSTQPSTVGVTTSGTVRSQPIANMMQDPAGQQPASATSVPAAPSSNTCTAQNMPMGPPPPRRPVSSDVEPSTSTGITRLVAESAGNRASKRYAMEAPSPDEGVSIRYQTAHAPMTHQTQGLLLQANTNLSPDTGSGPTPVMLQPVTNSTHGYMQAGPQMSMYAPHTQLVQMSGPPQHMGGYTMAMPQEMQGYRSYPQGQVMMVSQDWQQGNMGGQQVIMRSIQEQQWQQQ